MTIKNRQSRLSRSDLIITPGGKRIKPSKFKLVLWLLTSFSERRSRVCSIGQRFEEQHVTSTSRLTPVCVPSTVAMYLGIKKGKTKTVNPAPSDSLGVWGPPAPWSPVTSCGRFARCSTPTTATTSSKRVSCCCACTGTGGRRTWCSGRWRSASCRVSRSTASASNGYPDHPSLSKTLLPKLPMS